ncbi:MAG: hypothetical protein WBE24_07855, partial [Candidatus Acidiferrum sp.]
GFFCEAFVHHFPLQAGGGCFTFARLRVAFPVRPGPPSYELSVEFEHVVLVLVFGLRFAFVFAVLLGVSSIKSVKRPKPIC